MGLKMMGLLLSIVLAAGNVCIPKEKGEVLGMGQKHQESMETGMELGTGEGAEVKEDAEPEKNIDSRLEPEGGKEKNEDAESEKNTDSKLVPEESVEIKEDTEPEKDTKSERDTESEKGSEFEGNGEENEISRQGREKKREKQADGETVTEEIHMPVFYAARAAENEKYVVKDGYFYMFVRKQGESPEKGHWYRLNMSVPKLTAQKSQDIDWDMTYVGKMPKKETENISVWIASHGNKVSDEKDDYSLEIEKGKNWEKTRQDGLGINPVMGEAAPNLDELRPQGYPYKERYYMLCGKLLYTVNGYRIYFDNSVFNDMGGMDIEPENKEIQKKDSKLDEGEASWTGDGYFKFAIDTNNVGMTNYGSSGEFHHAMYGFYLKPNQYTIKYDANGGTGTMKSQSATYDKSLNLLKNGFVREGYTFEGWNTVKSGGQLITAYENGQSVKNLTNVHKGSVTMYAQWKPNTLTVTYHANGGNSSGKPYSIADYKSNWNYATEASAPEKFDSFGLARKGYSKRAGAEWNTAADGTGVSFSEEKPYSMLSYAPELKTGSRSCTLYAQWDPNIYAVSLDMRLTDPENAGTSTIYEKYENGWYLDKGCTTLLASKNKEGSIVVPEKSGYAFQGYYDAAVGGMQMIDAAGKMTSAGAADFKRMDNATWYAHYKCQISCEDYADVPCDFEKTEDDDREGMEVTLLCENGQITVKAGQTGYDVSLIGKPAGTKVGQFQSAAAGNSSSAFSGNAQEAVLPAVPQEGAAYQLKVTVQGKVLCDRIVYFRNGRFRTVVKLGTREKKEVAQGGSVAGSIWGTEDAAYPLYRYVGCSELRNIQSPGSVCRYFQYKNVNIAYSGNGATSGKNILEYNIPLENIYQLRKNAYAKKETKTKQTEDGKEYQCDVKYSFDGWELSAGKSYPEQQKEPAIHIYGQAKKDHAVLDRTIEPLAGYQPVGSVSDGSHILGYINFLARWNAFPTIVVTPGSSLEFYEGEEVSKEDLVNCLTAHDEEDNGKANQTYVPNLNDKVRIVKIIYPASKNGSQKAYEKVYTKDVPEGFLLDTYYLKLDKDEEIEAMVTFAVTDSNGNTTEEEIPVKVKYNHYPQISSEDIFYYFKEEANKGEITAEALAKRATAEDAEDGNLTDKLEMKDFDGQAIKMQTESSSEFDITYQVTDAYKKTSYKTVKLVVVDEDAAIAELPKYYVRYISDKYLDTLEEGSEWREPENYAYLAQVLGNETSMETWKFTHEDVLAAQDWVTAHGNWKTGQEANREFMAEFSRCRK